MAKILVVGALPLSLVNFRGDLIRALVGAGHEVVAMADSAPDGLVRDIESLGARFRPFPVQRNGMNPVRDLATLRALRRAFLELRPDVVLAYTIKPIIWGGLALRGLPEVRFFALVTGLGFAFQGGGFYRTGLARLATRLYRASLRRASRVIFQNQDNLSEFVGRRITRPESAAVVNGSGVDVRRFMKSALPAGNAVFLLIARLLREKGLREFAGAARLVKSKYPEVVCRLVGPPDPSPDGLPLAEVMSWDAQGLVEYLGETQDVRPHLAASHVFVLPSYHEGMPRTILEAMATGRPILTTEVPGCRETVVPGENGFLVPRGDVKALAERMAWFMEHRERWESMGERSRQMAEERFDVEKVNRELLKLMALGTGRSGPGIV
jgi:glycosyltransferase involved in cell wall biosynthesis